MNVNSVRTNSINTPCNYNSNKTVAFAATTSEIAAAAKKIKCPNKSKFLKSVADCFEAIQSNVFSKEGAPDKIVYNFGQKNAAPDFIKETPLEEIWLNLDERLNIGRFKCHTNATCGCGKGLSESEFAKELLTKLGVNEPDLITLSKTKQKKFNFFGLGTFFN